MATEGNQRWRVPKQEKKVLPAGEGHHELGQIPLTGEAGKGPKNAHLI